jgi:hypothetical protein
MDVDDCLPRYLYTKPADLSGLVRRSQGYKLLIASKAAAAGLSEAAVVVVLAAE